MQIEKIVKIEGIGRFLKLAAKGDVKFRSLTLLYGANGQGKTTIAGVLRSLQTGDADVGVKFKNNCMPRGWPSM